jgi:predicted Rossmann fold flavoprotein
MNYALCILHYELQTEKKQFESRTLIIMKRLVIVGGGAAGLTAAGNAAKRGLDVTVLERNDRPARKVMITGKGRCNVTNACTLINELMDAVPVNNRFLYGAFSRFMPYDTMDMFEDLGVKLKIERGNRVFPESDKAVDIVDALVKFAKSNGAKIKTDVRVTELITENNEIKGVRTEDGQEIPADAVIIATGGMSYPGTGSTGDGYALAKSVGHTITPLKGSLVPLETQESWCRDCMGLSLKNVSLSVYDKEKFKEVYSDFGEMLFTHFGVSGPMILSASSHMRDITPGRYVCTVDLKPALSEEKLDERILRDIAANPTKGLPTILRGLLPKSLVPVITEMSETDPSKHANGITRDERKELVYLLKNLSFTIKKARPIEEAIVTSGGVKVNEIDPKTMQSKICKGLYFAGEVIDVDAYTGGFNLQIAFATGTAAGKCAISN